MAPKSEGRAPRCSDGVGLTIRESLPPALVDATEPMFAAAEQVGRTCPGPQASALSHRKVHVAPIHVQTRAL